MLPALGTPAITPPSFPRTAIRLRIAVGRRSGRGARAPGEEEDGAATTRAHSVGVERTWRALEVDPLHDVEFVACDRENIVLLVPAQHLLTIVACRRKSRI